jgi:cytoskeletal protein CcmA (bactofilin family)
MFKAKDKNMAKNGEFDSNNVTTISTGTVVNGDITSEGDFRIVGKLIGSVNSKGKVVIGKTGQVEGNIHCQNADFSGSVIGNVIVENMLLLKASSNLKGDIKTEKLSIESGALFSGNCLMSNSNVKSSNEKKQAGKES